MAENKLEERVGLADSLKTNIVDVARNFTKAGISRITLPGFLSNYKGKLGQFQPHTKIDAKCSCGHEYRVTPFENLTFDVGVVQKGYHFDAHGARGSVLTYGITDVAELIVFKGVCPNCNHQQPVLYELTGRSDRRTEPVYKGSGDVF